MEYTYAISNKKFEIIVLSSFNYAEICKKMGLRCSGPTYSIIKKRILQQNLSVNHFIKTIHQDHFREVPLNEVFKKNSSYSNSKGLKNKILKNKYLEYKCKKCGNKGEWQNDVLVLQLDHINGNRKDNRIENLRFLCPNCHTQTTTHSGKRFKKPLPKCSKCGCQYSGYGKKCKKCDQFKRRKVKNRPTKPQLKKMIEESSHRAVARKYVVSDTTIKRWFKSEL